MYKHVFIVDDDIDDIEILTEALNSVDETISCNNALNGAEGLAKLKDKEIPTPDIIFLDLNMPLINVRQFLERVKREEMLKDIPVVMYSTSGIAAEINEVISMGATGYIVKPDSLSSLVKELKKLFTAPQV